MSTLFIRWLRYGFVFLVGCLLFLGLWNKRWIADVPFDPEYQQEIYVFSQWSVPQSPRILGDGGLYMLAGHQYVTQTFQPFTYAPEVPPLGKVMLGWSAVWFGSPYWLSVGLLVASLWLLAVLLRQLRVSATVYWLSLVLWLLQPLVWDQVGSALLDLPLLVWVLLHVVCLWASSTQSRVASWFALVLSGVFLGAMMATKIAAFAPVLGILAAWYLYRTGHVWRVIVVGMVAVLTYTAVYLPWILDANLGGSWAAWIAGQKWMVKFYLSSDIQVVLGMSLITWLTGWYRGWWGAGWQWSGMWSPVYWLAIMAWGSWARAWWQVDSTVLWRRVLQRIGERQARWEYAALFGPALLLAMVPMPFWPRFLLLVLPWAVIFAARWLVEQRVVVQLIVGVVAVACWLPAFWSSPNDLVALAQQQWSQGAWADILQHANHQQPQWKEQQRALNTRLRELDAKRITVSLAPQESSLAERIYEATVTVETLTGTLSATTRARAWRDHGRWYFAADELLPAALASPPVSLGSTGVWVIEIDPSHVQNWADVIAGFEAEPGWKRQRLLTEWFVLAPGPRSAVAWIVSTPPHPTLSAIPGVTVRQAPVLPEFVTFRGK